MEKSYADIIIDISHEKVDRPFQYKIPNRLKEELEVGMEVVIPFGSGNTRRSGYVMDITDRASYPPEKLKEIIEIAQKGMTVEDRFLQLAHWIKTQYGSTMITALKTVLPVKQKMKTVEKRSVRLLLTKEEAEEKIAFYQKKNQVARQRLLLALKEEESIPLPIITDKLNVTSKTVVALKEQGILEILEESTYRNPIARMELEERKYALSNTQEEIVDAITQASGGSIHLVHGITGSGKTEVYMELIAQVLKEGKQAIVLIPEIALTFQTVMRFYKRFGDCVSVMNSKLSKGERFDQMERAKKGEVKVMIGPRSALFTPFSHLGIIIIDEEHESSYKSETMPKYHARETAIQLSNMHGAKVVLGSATPSLEAYYQAKNGNIALYTMKERLTGGELPKVYVEDLREELKAGNRSVFSRKLKELIEDRLEKKEQIMLFLNRRGYAGFISCRACGHVMQCPHCAISLSEHRDQKLHCHYCGYTIPAVSTCPKCQSKYISSFKAGTQQIEELLAREYPKARVLRMDADTTRTKDSYSEILAAFANQEADILIGTQMIVKGHDFKEVTLVGILAADLSLAANDYRAGERTFQLLTQAAGRAGRGSKAGEVVIQTYQPEHYSVIHASKQDYEAFYEEEMMYREFLSYPPAASMMAVLIGAKEEERGQQTAKRLTEQISKKQVYQECVLVGPASAGISKINDVYRILFYVKHPDKNILIQIKDEIENYVQEQGIQENVQIDFNPMSAY